jgi:hypothetical protein
VEPTLVTAELKTGRSDQTHCQSIESNQIRCTIVVVVVARARKRKREQYIPPIVPSLLAGDSKLLVDMAERTNGLFLLKVVDLSDVVPGEVIELMREAIAEMAEADDDDLGDLGDDAEVLVAVDGRKSSSMLPNGTRGLRGCLELRRTATSFSSISQLRSTTNHHDDDDDDGDGDEPVQSRRDDKWLNRDA